LKLHILFNTGGYKEKLPMEAEADDKVISL